MADGILDKALISLATTAILSVLSLLFRSVRTALFYKRVEYDLPCQRATDQSPFSCSWDIHWEDYGVTFHAGDISDDKIGDAVFSKLSGKKERIPELFPSDTFHSLFKGEIQVKVNSIVRLTPAAGAKVYTLRLVFRRRRFF